MPLIAIVLYAPGAPVAKTTRIYIAKTTTRVPTHKCTKAIHTWTEDGVWSVEADPQNTSESARAETEWAVASTAHVLHFNAVYWPIMTTRVTVKESRSSNDKRLEAALRPQWF